MHNTSRTVGRFGAQEETLAIIGICCVQGDVMDGGLCEAALVLIAMVAGVVPVLMVFVCSSLLLFEALKKAGSILQSTGSISSAVGVLACGQRATLWQAGLIVALLMFLSGVGWILVHGSR